MVVPYRYVGQGRHGGFRRLLRNDRGVHLAVAVGNERAQEVRTVGLEVRYAQGEAVIAYFLGNQGLISSTGLEQGLRYLYAIGRDIGHILAEAAVHHHRHARDRSLVHRQLGSVRQIGGAFGVLDAGHGRQGKNEYCADTFHRA